MKTGPASSPGPRSITRVVCLFRVPSRERITWKATRLIPCGVRIKVFCASMCDVFDAEVDPAWRVDLWDLIRGCRNLDWQLLTKRPENIRAMLPEDWGEGWPHVWLGAIVEDQIRAAARIPVLAGIPAALRFLSVEPLLGPVCGKV